MINKTDYINKLIKENGFKSYLEIGLGDAVNFSNVECENKVGTDPERKETSSERWLVLPHTSNEFFKNVDGKWDLIFIDGLHHSDQVERDIVNAWNCLNKGGCILIHDIKPHDEQMTLVPRQQKVWTGDVYKAWYGFLQKYPKIKTEFVNEQYGIGVIWKSRHKVTEGFVSDISFDEYREWLKN